VALVTASAMLYIIRAHLQSSTGLIAADLGIVDALISRYITFVAAIIVLGGIITLVLGVLFIHRVAGPALRLERNLRLLAGGTPPEELKIVIRPKDYLGDLMASFNVLLAVIQRERERRKETVAQAGKQLEEIARRAGGEIATKLQDVEAQVRSLGEPTSDKGDEKE